MIDKKRSAIRAQITYEVHENNNAGSEELSYYDYDDVYNNKSNIENDTFDVEFDLPESVDDFIEALERWNDFIPDEVSKDDFEEGFGMMQYEDDYDEDDDMAEFASSQQEFNSEMTTSIPQKIVIYFDDGSEEEVEITNQEDTLKRVLDIVQ